MSQPIATELPCNNVENMTMYILISYIYPICGAYLDLG